MFKEVLFVFPILLMFPEAGLSAAGEDINNNSENSSEIISFFNNEDSSRLPSKKLLQTALNGYNILVEEQVISRTEVITIIDYSLPSDKERLWVIDLMQKRVLFRCLVSHGRNSGENIAENFSNTPGSNASSPGFYSTAETYIGKHGLSLVLDGLETGINDNARKRSIVIHGAEYVSSDFVKNNGRLGRSLGCPAVPEELSEGIIESIKGGSCLFISEPYGNYDYTSHILSLVASITKK